MQLISCSISIISRSICARVSFTASARVHSRVSLYVCVLYMYYTYMNAHTYMCMYVRVSLSLSLCTYVIYLY